MSQLHAIIAGNPSGPELVEAFRSAGVDIKLSAPERGAAACDLAILRTPGHRPDAYRVIGSEKHFTWHDLCPFPHVILEATHTVGTEQALRAVIGKFGGWLRSNETWPARLETIMPEAGVENPLFLFKLSVDEALPHAREEVKNALVRCAHDNPRALQALAAAVSRHVAPLVQEATDELEAASSPRV